MVGFLQFLGILSIVGSFIGISEFAQIDTGYGIMRMNPYIVAGFLGSALITFGIFWGLAAIIANLQKINEKLEKEGD